MNSTRVAKTSPNAVNERIAEEIVDRGFSICQGFVEPGLVSGLVEDTRRLWDDGQFSYAKVGLGEERQRCPTVRSDRIHWLEEQDLTPAQTSYMESLEGLRSCLNRATMMGLFEWEGHLAVYPSGTFYRRHLDVFRHARERKISTILYLNEGWTPVDGGELRLYLNGAEVDEFIDIAPRAGTLVTFLSDEFYHEVLPAHESRMSITGWFRVRSLSSR